MINMRIFSFVFLVMVLQQFSVHCNAQDDLFSAVASLENLLNTQGALVTSVQSYIFSQEKNFERIKKYFNSIRMQEEIAYKNKARFLGNPIHAFLLIKRLSIDWFHVRKLITKSSDELIQISSKDQFKYPTIEDFEGACDAIGRLQDTYLLEATSLASGEIQGRKTVAKLLAGDCLALGLHAYNRSNFHQSIEWLEEALSRAKLDNIPPGQKESILEYLSLGYGHVGNTAKAMQYTKELLKIAPKNEGARSAGKYYQNIASDEQDIDTSTNYKELCRGEDKIDAGIKSKLNCYYFKPKENKFLTIAPFKVEEAFHSPQILIFYDVLSDSETKMLKHFATPSLRRAYVSSGGPGIKIDGRIGKSAWLDPINFPDIESIDTRISDMTGLSMYNSEPLQVLNYGIGGYYGIHHDFMTHDTSESGGNRIATVLFYLNDVTLGGATVFPMLGLSLRPKKGAAAFWYNLHLDLQEDNRTLHAACPVLAGSKWVCNKWIRDPAQIFRKPCGLKPTKVIY